MNESLLSRKINRSWRDEGIFIKRKLLMKKISV